MKSDRQQSIAAQQNSELKRSYPAVSPKSVPAVHIKLLIEASDLVVGPVSALRRVECGGPRRWSGARFGNDERGGVHKGEVW